MRGVSLLGLELGRGPAATPSGLVAASVTCRESIAKVGYVLGVQAMCIVVRVRADMSVRRVRRAGEQREALYECGVGWRAV